MRIVLATDAWSPQINGVVTTYLNLRRELLAKGHEFHVIEPNHFTKITCPFYRHLDLAIFVKRRLRQYLESLEFDVIHIATEGPIGWAARAWCLANDVPYTTSYHTQFPQYLKRYLGVPESYVYQKLQAFHAPAAFTLVPTRSVRDELRAHDFGHLRVWTRGVDRNRFHPGRKTEFLGVEGPRFLYCGRVAEEKGIDRFLSLDLPGTKIVVGDGPQLPSLKKRYPDVVWTGFREGEELARSYRSADVFVFPSETDTFGVVQLEALASGLPVAALPVTGPRDVITDPRAGVLDWDLKKACLQCLELRSEDTVAFSEHFRWETVANIFLEIARPTAELVGNYSRANPQPVPISATA